SGHPLYRSRLAPPGSLAAHAARDRPRVAPRPVVQPAMQTVAGPGVRVKGPDRASGGASFEVFDECSGLLHGYRGPWGKTAADGGTRRLRDAKDRAAGHIFRAPGVNH